MSIERINQINTELIELCITLKEVVAKALPLIKELEELGVPLPAETRQMFYRLTKMGG